MSISRSPNPTSPFDLRDACDALRGGKTSHASLFEWLSDTYASPERFRVSLFALAARRKGGIASRPDATYCFYHDCVASHLSTQRRAFVSAGPSGDVELSFEALHVRCSALAAAWMARGVKPGDVVAVVLPMSAEYLVAVLTALRLGAIVAPLPPRGPTFVRNRLEKLAPDHVVATERHRKMLTQDPLPISTTLADPRIAPFYSYRPDEPAARLFSPLSDADANPFDIAAASLLEGLLRDGLLIFGIDEAETLAAPGFDEMQHQPHLALSALAAGGAWAEVTPGDIERDSRVLSRLGVTVLGVSRQVRETFLQSGPGIFPRSCRAYFRSLTDRLDIGRWDELARELWAHNKVMSFDVLANAASGGVHLFRPRGEPPLVTRVWPAPGRTFRLSETGAPKLAALSEAGAYTPLIGEETDASMPRVLLARDATGFVFAGVIDPGRDGHSYPSREVSRVCERVAPGARVSAVVVPGQWQNDAHVALVVFVEDARDKSGRFSPPIDRAALLGVIRRELGDRAVPDRVEFFPLSPRMTLGEVDAGWCRSSYLRGALHEKAHSEMFVLLSRLKYMIALDRGARG